MLREGIVFSTLTALFATSPLLGGGCGASSCCNPVCCVPVEKPCIDCECYTPPYYDLQCAYGFSLSVEFLYWYARETNLNYAIDRQVDLFTNGDAVFNKVAGGEYFVTEDKIENFGTSWDPGGRASLGWNMACDGWDMLLSYTYFKDKTSAKASSNIGQVMSGTTAVTNDITLLLNPWQLQDITTVSGTNFTAATIPGWDTVKASWTLYFNVVDLELGRKYWLSRCMALRPYFGLRGGFLETKLKVTSHLMYTDTTSTKNTFSLVDRVTNRSWGAGFVLGLQPEWHFCDWFILYSHADLALLWGNFKSHAKETNTFLVVGSKGPGSGGSSYELKNSFAMMQPILDLALGLRWEETWCCDRYRTQLDAGWEYHLWFDYNHRMNKNVQISTKGSINPNYVERTGNLMLSGLVIRFGFDF